MQYRRRLRSRIIVAFVALGFGLTALFAASTLLLRARVENQLVEDWLREEARAFLEFKRVNPDPAAPYFLSANQIEVFAYRPDSPRVPLAWAELKSGVYDMKEAYSGARDENFKL